MVSFNHPTCPSEEESQNKSRADPVGFKAAPGWCPFTGKGNGQNANMQNHVKSETVVPTETRLQHSVLDQAAKMHVFIDIWV